MKEAAALAAQGVKELVIIAQDTTYYGLDLYGKRCLAELLRKLSAVEGIEWLRLHYLYVDQFDDELIDEIADNPKIVKYLDIPIQHINNQILKRMNRRGTGDEIRALFNYDPLPDGVGQHVPARGEYYFVDEGKDGGNDDE